MTKSRKTHNISLAHSSSTVLSVVRAHREHGEYLHHKSTKAQKYEKRENELSSAVRFNPFRVLVIKDHGHVEHVLTLVFSFASLIVSCRFKKSS